MIGALIVAGLAAVSLAAGVELARAAAHRRDHRRPQKR
jgi:hypothetical protein